MRVILADHHRPPLWALKTMLEEEPEFDPVGEALDAESLLLLAQKHTADLILVDRELPGGHIEDLIASLHALEPRPVVVVMSSGFEYSRMVLKAGADAFVSKSDEPEWLLGTLRQYAERTKKAGGSENSQQ